MPEPRNPKKRGAAPAEDIPAENKTPFLVKKVQCPVCKFRSDQRRFKLKIYGEKNVDLDKHIQLYNWIDKDFNKYHPPLYYLWHCPNCYFTESFMDFENPGKQLWSNFRILKDIFSEKTQDDPKIEKLVSWLSKGIDYDNMNYVQAVRLHLLANFIQLLPDDELDRDSLKIGPFLPSYGMASP